MATVLGIDHVSLLVSDAERSKQFYQKILSLPVLERPDLGFPGYWLGLGSNQTLHIMELPNPEGVKEEQRNIPVHGGRDRHFALTVDSVKAFVIRLNAEGLTFTESRSGRPAIFFRDPDGNALELFEKS